MRRNRCMWPVAIVAVVLLLAGCSSAPTRLPPVAEPGVADRESGVPAESPPGQVAVPPAAVDRHAPSPAVVALLQGAESQANAGQLDAAAASIERALRIEPANPLLWYHLASVRLEQGDPSQAEQLAVKSNRLAVGNRVQQSRNWQLIARARAMRNDLPGAEQARREARALAGE